MILNSSITVPEGAVLTATLSISVGEWRQIRDDLKSIQIPSAALSELALSLDQLIAKVGV